MQDIDFLIIGAAKSATTWLQQCLQTDPEIYMPDPELHFFSREFHRGSDWYLSHFRRQQGMKLVGEKSNSYLESAMAPARIKAHLPHAKLVSQLRNPVERAYSDYCMLYRRGEVTGDIRYHLDPRTSADQRFLAGGQYHRQLRTFYELFPESQLLVQFFEDVRSDPLVQLNQTRVFLGLAPVAAVPLAEAKIKDKSTPMLGPTLRWSLRPLKPWVASLRHRPSFQRLHGFFARETKYPELGVDLRRRLLDHYVPDIEALGKMIGRDLSFWMTGGRANDFDSESRWRRSDSRPD